MSVPFSADRSSIQRVARAVRTALIAALVTGCATKPVPYAFSGVEDRDSFTVVNAKLEEATFRLDQFSAPSPSARRQDPRAMPGELLPMFWSGRVLNLDVTVYGYFDDQERLDRLRVERKFLPGQLTAVEALSAMTEAQMQDMVKEQREQIQPQLERECEAFAQSLQDRYGKGELRPGPYSEVQPMTYSWRNRGNGIDLRCYVQSSNIDDATLRALGVIEVDYRYRAFGSGRL
ncbi:hypothetical protein [Deinococcus soli (ex Cha et al. 2016)]|uniref:Uncharacterized protein n=2 Tax=Deinococcus soli (ex Cha et al. 2016) TaxID=1309411 RepID=A0AAE4BQE6_9DEIO|nr:hypothetical protein [Deinococcus soli (ex Cha et al. 2016)]MDR6221209.1 hypothetical protein [Deinococcus soli (ex Cha et al. 2016)]MDR6331165.1 hypothetical protein [Deinococcus soli (ex Cha et al. 2016)]MDR6754328.1 hypothetical protein [Deinococcus soli (ex Cha et al. 2016)]